MSGQQVAVIPRCAECGEHWLTADRERWCAYLDSGDDVVLFCPDCAAGEFGD